MPSHVPSPVFICPHLLLETTSFPSLAWPGGCPAQKSRCHSPLREKQVEVREEGSQRWLGLEQVVASLKTLRLQGLTAWMEVPSLAGVGHGLATCRRWQGEKQGRSPLSVSWIHTSRSCKCLAEPLSGSGGLEW